VWSTWQRRSLDKAASSLGRDGVSNAASFNKNRPALSTSLPRQYHRMHGSSATSNNFRDGGGISSSSSSSSSRSNSNRQKEVPSRPVPSVGRHNNQDEAPLRPDPSTQNRRATSDKHSAGARNGIPEGPPSSPRPDRAASTYTTTENLLKSPLPNVPRSVEVAAAAAAIMAHVPPKTMTPEAAAQAAGQLAAAATALHAWGAEEWAVLAAANCSLQAAWAQLGAR